MAPQSTPKSASKESKDLSLLIAAIKSSKTKLDIDYDEFMKIDDAPTKQAAQMRLSRLSKSLGVELSNGRGGGGKAARVAEQPKRKAAGEKQAKVHVEEEEEEEEDEEDDEPQNTPAKKVKVKVEEWRNGIGDEEDEL